MKQLLRVTGVIGFAVLLAACATTTKTTTVSGTSQKYSEDLSTLRPKTTTSTGTTGGTSTSPTETRKQTPYVEPKYAVNKKLDNVLDSIDRINVQRTVIEGFTIQVYSGSRKEDAMKAKQELASSLPDLQSEVLYLFSTSVLQIQS